VAVAGFEADGEAVGAGGHLAPGQV
jgi:hypothetical protein